MSKALAAGLGAVAVQLFSSLAPIRASWGWTVTWNLTVPRGDFSCQEGNTLTFEGEAFSAVADFTCTVVPDSGKTCDVGSIRMRCSDPKGEPQSFHPTAGSCVQSGAYANSNVTLSWSQAPACTASAEFSSVAEASGRTVCALTALLAVMNL
ncbi:unnamed protein product [Symbiodinium sp. KB8]|nr:unnamed protein product [Symbiodinium sp. KB8]